MVTKGGKRAGAGRPKANPLTKRKAVCVRLPKWLLNKMAEKPESSTEQIETALIKLNGWEQPKIGE